MNATDKLAKLAARKKSVSIDDQLKRLREKGNAWVTGVPAPMPVNQTPAVSEPVPTPLPVPVPVQREEKPVIEAPKVAAEPVAPANPWIEKHAARFARAGNSAQSLSQFLYEVWFAEAPMKAGAPLMSKLVAQAGNDTRAALGLLESEISAVSPARRLAMQSPAVQAVKPVTAPAVSVAAKSDAVASKPANLSILDMIAMETNASY